MIGRRRFRAAMGARLRFLYLAPITFLLAGCFWMKETAPADRCARVASQALPEGSLKQGRQTARAEVDSGNSDIVAIVTGRYQERDVVAECSFHRGVIVGFRWIDGFGR
jgi:hypothetical protein